MKRIAFIMGMPVIVEVKNNDENLKVEEDIEKVFEYLRWIDETFSPFKETSEVAKYNRGEKYSHDLADILNLAEETKIETGGYFNVVKLNGKMDPSGIVKGWAIWKAADILKKLGYKKFYVDVAGDAEIVGGPWKWGIRNPFNVKEIVKVISLTDRGIATSGTYERGQHIYNPVAKKSVITDIVSLTIIGPNVYEADRFATAAFAMGKEGINFIQNLAGFEGYMINKDAVASMTSGFKKYETG